MTSLTPDTTEFHFQASHLTGGIYARPARPAGLLQHLLTVFLPDPEMREFLTLPRGAPVGLCFHNNLHGSARHVRLGMALHNSLTLSC